MQTPLTFILAFLCLLPVFVRQLLGKSSFVNSSFLSIYILITTILFVLIVIYDVITFINKKAPPSIKYLALLSAVTLMGFLPDLNSNYYGFLGFLGFLAFMTYQKEK